mgnify:CR=1 FL=1
MAKIVLKNVRINFPRLAIAQENRYSQDGRKFYSAQIVIAEDDKENLQKVAAGMKEAFVAKFGDKAERVFAQAKENRNTRGLQHDTERKRWYINVKRREENGAPIVYSADLKRTLTTQADMPKSGDYIDVVVQSWCYDASGSKGVSFELVSIHFRQEGEPFEGSGIRATADDFEALAPSAANDDFSDIDAFA